MKRFLKFLFRGLYSNEEILEGRKVYKYWVAIIFGLVSLIISVIPSFVSIARTSGSDIMNNTQYNASLDRSLVLFSRHLQDEKIDLIVNTQGKIDTNTKINPQGQDEDEYSVMSQGKEIFVVRMVKVADGEQEAEAIKKYRTMYAEGRNSLEGKVSVTPRSNMIITERYIYITTYLHTDSNVNTLTDDESGVSKFAQTNGSYIGELEYGKGLNFASLFKKDAANQEKSSIDAWTKALDQLYEPSKVRYMWAYTGVIMAINFGVMLIISILIMVLTRLKSSKGDKLNYFQALEVVAYASVTPALITLIAGFFMTQLATIGFVLILGLRSTFLGMRASNPENYVNK